MPYYDNVWHIDAHENILSPDCLIGFVKSKTENQLIRFVIAYLVADNSLKCETVAARRDPRLHHSRPIILLTALTLVLWITGYVEYCRNVFIRNLWKLNVDELKRLLIEAWFRIQQSVTDQAIDQFLVRFYTRVKAKWKHFENVLW